jgi:hypothetical protein
MRSVYPDDGKLGADDPAVAWLPDEEDMVIDAMEKHEVLVAASCLQAPSSPSLAGVQGKLRHEEELLHGGSLNGWGDGRAPFVVGVPSPSHTTKLKELRSESQAPPNCECASTATSNADDVLRHRRRGNVSCQELELKRALEMRV